MFSINNHKIGKNYPTYIIAELSCNHNQDINIAYKLIDEAKKSGANAIKLQTYTADTMTIKSDNPLFKDCLNGTLWEGKTLYDLYLEAYTPWEWTKGLKEYANSLEMDLFSSPFDTTAVDFLETLDIPAYKIASFEIVDHVLIKRIAQTGKPVIISSGMASFEELQEAIDLLRNNGCSQICMLKCTSAYPAKLEDANLITMKDMAKKFNVITGLSDHTLDIEVPITSVLLGGCIIEKHFTLSRECGSPDDAFSLNPIEFKKMVDSIRKVEKISGKITYGGVKKESTSKKFRKSLFVVEDIKKGEKLTSKNVRPIRPSYGIHTKFYEYVIGETALVDIKKGTPLHLNLISCSSEKLKNQKEINDDILVSQRFYEKYDEEIKEIIKEKEECNSYQDKANMYIFASKDTYSSKILFQKISYENEYWHRISNKTKLLEIIKKYPQYKIKIFFFHWSYIVPASIYNNYECINIHTSNLPYCKGGSPIQNQILDNIKISKVNALQMSDDGLDAGPVYCSQEISLQGSLQDIWLIISNVSSKLIRNIIENNIKPTTQKLISNVKCYKRRKCNKIPFDSNDIIKIYDFIRMLDSEEYPNPFIEIDNYKLEFNRSNFNGKKIHSDVIITKL